jgi:hypothetical protein
MPVLSLQVSIKKEKTDMQNSIITRLVQSNKSLAGHSLKPTHRLPDKAFVYVNYLDLRDDSGCVATNRGSHGQDAFGQPVNTGETHVPVLVWQSGIQGVQALE